MTIFCRSMSASLNFYSDLIGLVVVERKTIEGPAAGGLLQLPACRMEIALLAPSADANAILGLFEISAVDLDRLTLPVGKPAIGQTSLVLSTDDFSGTHMRLSDAGVRFLTPPVRYPKRQASERSPAGIYHEMIAYDPDGILVSVMQIEPIEEDVKA